jgi:quercetin dioxygenase-like cupin family protein
MYVDVAEVAPVEMLPGFWRQTLAWGDELMLVLFRMRKDAELTAHHHVHEQVGYVIEGNVELTVAGVRRPTPVGCCYFVDSDRLHQADVLADALVIDAFSPPRLDYLPGAAQDFGAGTDGGVYDDGGRSATLLAARARPLTVAPGAERRPLLGGRLVTMSLLTLEAGARVPSPPAAHERAGYVVSGTVRAELADGERRCDSGSSFLARRGAPAGLVAEEAAMLVLAEAGSEARP